MTDKKYSIKILKLIEDHDKFGPFAMNSLKKRHGESHKNYIKKHAKETKFVVTNIRKNN